MFFSSCSCFSSASTNVVSIDAAAGVGGAKAYDLALCDEAAMLRLSQILTLLHVVKRLTRVFLVGDKHQAAPLVHSPIVKRTMLATGALEAFLGAGAPEATITEQHRMPRDRATALGMRVYGAPFTSSAAVAEDSMLIWRRLTTSMEPRGTSFVNVAEAQWAVGLCKSVKKSKVGSLAVFTYYAAPAALVEELLGTESGVDVLTVAKVQGSEWDRIILLTTTNKPGRFVLDQRSAVVGFSRDKRGIAASAVEEFVTGTPAGRSFLDCLHTENLAQDVQMAPL